MQGAPRPYVGVAHSEYTLRLQHNVQLRCRTANGKVCFASRVSTAACGSFSAAAFAASTCLPTSRHTTSKRSTTIQSTQVYTHNTKAACCCCMRVVAPHNMQTRKLKPPGYCRACITVVCTGSARCCSRSVMGPLPVRTDAMQQPTNDTLCEGWGGVGVAGTECRGAGGCNQHTAARADCHVLRCVLSGFMGGLLDSLVQSDA